MKRKMILGLILLGVFALLALNVRVGYAEPSTAPRTTGYEISWYTIDGGGSMSIGGGYALNGAIGQPDAGLLAGGGYSLLGGFWGGAAPAYTVYLPVVLRQ